MASNTTSPALGVVGGDDATNFNVTTTHTYEHRTMTLTPEEEDVATQYRRMLTMGLPVGAVLQKMIIDGVDESIQDSVLAPSPPAVSGGDNSNTANIGPSNNNNPSSDKSSGTEYYEESTNTYQNMKPESSNSLWEEEIVDDDENGRSAILEEEILDGEYDEEEFMEEVVDEQESSRRLEAAALGAAVLSDGTNNMTDDEFYAANLQYQFEEEEKLRQQQQQQLASTEDGAMYRSGHTTTMSSDAGVFGSTAAYNSTAMSSSTGVVMEEGQYQAREVLPNYPPLEQAPPPQVLMYGVKEPAEKPRPSPSQLWFWVPCFLLVGLIGAGVGIGYSLATPNDDNFINVLPENRTLAPTASPTVGVTTEFEPVTGDCNFIGVDFPNPIDQCDCAGAILAIPTDVESRYQTNLDNFISTLYPTFDEDITSCTARNQALVWLSSGNDVTLTVEERTQNFALATLFASTGGARWDDRSDWLADSDPCSWFGLECDDNGFVSEMNLEGNNVIGVVRNFGENEDVL
jgi:hypothetical protein